MPTSARPFARVACALLFGLLLASCQSDEAEFTSLLESGKAHAEAGEHPAAIIELRKALKLQPNSAEAHFALAESFVQTGNGRDALWEYSETIRLDPDHWTARLKLGALSLVAGNHEEAVEQGTAAVALVPDEPNAHLLLGQGLEGLGRADEAEKEFLTALELAEEKAAMLFALGQLYSQRGDRARAEPVLVKLTEVEPGALSYSTLARFLAEDPSRDENTEAAFQRAIELASSEEQGGTHENLARFLIARGRLEDASTTLESALAELEESPDQRMALTQLLAEVLERREMGDEAAALLEAAVNQDPDSSQAQLLLASLRKRNGDVVGAVEAAERAVKISPESLPAKLQLAELLIEAAGVSENPAQIEEARGFVDAVLAKESTNPAALYSRGRIQLADKNVEGAIQSFRASIDARPDSAPAHYMLGRSLVGAGDARAGRGEVARALELDPTLTSARRLLIQLHAMLGEDEYAIEQGRLYLNRNPDAEIRMLVAQSLARLGRTKDALVAVERIPEDRRGTEVTFAKAQLLLADGQVEAARDELLAAHERIPNHPEILRSLMQMEARLGNVKSMGPRIDAALAAEPNNEKLILLRGVYAERIGDLENAEAMYRRTLEMNEANAEASQQLARIYERTGKLQEAVSIYEQALSKTPDSSLLHNALAGALQRQGKTQEAIATYEKAVALDGELSQAKNNLAYLLAESGTDLQRALDLAQEAKAQRPNDPGTADTLGWVLYRRGVPGAAVGYLREAVAGLEPGTPEMGTTRHHLALAYEANDQKELAIETLELALAELETQRKQAQAAGGELPDPEWTASARETLVRLKQG
jgi:tetratricopeptide (TPR) repeat protein